VFFFSSARADRRRSLSLAPLLLLTAPPPSKTQARKTNQTNKTKPQEKKKKWEPPAPPPRVGKKQRRRDQAAFSAGGRLPTVAPNAKCKLRLLKLERVKDYLLMEGEFVARQEAVRPADQRQEEERGRVDDMRGSPLSVGTLEEIVDESVRFSTLFLFLRRSFSPSIPSASFWWSSASFLLSSFPFNCGFPLPFLLAA